MFVLFLIVALIAGAVLLALNARERVEGLLLFDEATGAAVLEGWSILAHHSVIAGILATVVFLLALAIGLSTSELHIRAALRLRREWLDRRYRDDQLGVARDDCRRLRKQLEDAQRQHCRRQGPTRQVPAFPAPGHAGARPRAEGCR